MPSKKSRKGKRSKTTVRDLEHLLRNHLTVRFDPRKDLVEIGWVCECDDKSCEVPHTTVAFYSCPYRPCPPWS